MKTYIDRKINESIVCKMHNKLNKTYYKYTTNILTLPQMTSRTAPSGTITSNWAEFNSPNYGYFPVYNPFFGKNSPAYNVNYSSSGRGYKYIKYTFDKPLLFGEYILSFYYERQPSVTSTDEKWEVIYTNGDIETVWSTVETPTSGNYSTSFIANKNIESIQFSMNAYATQDSGSLEGISNVCLTSGDVINVVNEVTGIIKTTESDSHFYEENYTYYCIN